MYVPHGAIPPTKTPVGAHAWAACRMGWAFDKIFSIVRQPPQNQTLDAGMKSQYRRLVSFKEETEPSKRTINPCHFLLQVFASTKLLGTRYFF